MNPQNPQLEVLAEQLDTIRRRTVFGTKMTALVYGLLVVFVFIYTNFIISSLKKAATADNLSAVVKTTVQSQLPALRHAVVKSAKDSTPMLADYLVSLPREVVPIIEERVKELANDQVDAIAIAVKSDLVPRLIEVLDQNAEAINLTAETLKDQSVANALSILLVGELEGEMDKLFNEHFRKSCGELRDQLDMIREKPANQLAKREMVERQLLVNWVFLTEHGDAYTAYGNVLERLGHTYEFLFGTFQKKILVDDNEKDTGNDAN